MTSTGIGAVYLETHNWGRSVAFLRSLGLELEFETDHASGQLRGSDGPPVFVAEIPEDRAVGAQLVLSVTDAEAVVAAAGIEVVSPLEDTHYGTREMTVRDPDGRHWVLQVPGSAS